MWCFDWGEDGKIVNICFDVFYLPDCSFPRQVHSTDSTFPCSWKAGKTENLWERVWLHSKRFYSIMVSSFGSISNISNIWFCLVFGCLIHFSSKSFFEKMIQPHLFQMYWNHKFQGLRWWFQKWQGPHSSWRKGSPVAQSLTGVKLLLCRDSTDDCFHVMSVCIPCFQINWPLFISFRIVS